MADRPVTPEQTNQPVTDRPDRLTTEARTFAANVRRRAVRSPERIAASIEDFAGALEAAQKERDFWEQRYKTQHGTLHRIEARVRQLEEEKTDLEHGLADEAAMHELQKRVAARLRDRERQLEEALSCAVDDAVDRWHETCPNEERSLAEWLGLTQEQYVAFVADWRAIIPVLAARDALVAKENTTP